MLLVGDRERDRAIVALRRAYAGGYLDASQLERRIGFALHARTAFELASSVRGIPGGVMALAVHAIVRPALQRRTLGLRVAFARLIMRLALGAWWMTTALLAAVAGLWALAAGLPLTAGIALALIWALVSGLALTAYRGARRLLRP